jgi:hypothetical protein
LPLELEELELEELELDELELELELLLDERPLLELLELLEELLLELLTEPPTGSAPQAVKAAIEHANSVLCRAVGNDIAKSSKEMLGGCSP